MSRVREDYPSLFPCADGACLIDPGKLDRARDRLETLAPPREAGSGGLSISVFGKKNCPTCRETEKRVKASSAETTAKLVFYDLDTVDGLVEGSLQNALEVPTTIIRRGEEELARWEGQAPPLPELKTVLR